MDDPVEVYDRICANIPFANSSLPNHEALRALAAHYRKEGMRKAAGICDALYTQSSHHAMTSESFKNAILRAAEEVK